MRATTPALVAIVLGFVALPARAQVGVSTARRDVVVFHTDAPGQDTLRAYVRKGGQTAGLRVIECNVNALDDLVRNVPPTLRREIIRLANRLEREGIISDATVLLQAYTLVPSVKVETVPFGEEVTAGNFEKIEIFIIDVAHGTPPSPTHQKKIKSWRELFFNMIGVITGLLLIVSWLQPAQERIKTKVVCFLVSAVVIIAAGIADPQAAADFMVTTLVIPVFAWMGILLLGSFFSMFGWWMLLFRLMGRRP